MLEWTIIGSRIKCPSIYCPLIDYQYCPFKIPKGYEYFPKNIPNMTKIDRGYPMISMKIFQKNGHLQCDLSKKGDFSYSCHFPRGTGKNQFFSVFWKNSQIFGKLYISLEKTTKMSLFGCFFLIIPLRLPISPFFFHKSSLLQDDGDDKSRDNKSRDNKSRDILSGRQLLSLEFLPLKAGTNSCKIMMECTIFGFRIKCPSIYCPSIYHHYCPIKSEGFGKIKSGQIGSLSRIINIGQW